MTVKKKCIMQKSIYYLMKEVHGLKKDGLFDETMWGV